MLEVIPKDTIRIRLTARRKLAHSGNLSVEVNDHVLRAEHLNSPHFPCYAASFESPGPHFYMFLHNGGPSTLDRTRWVDELRVRPIVFAIRRSIGPVPGIDKTIDHGDSCALRLIGSRASEGDYRYEQNQPYDYSA